MEVTELGLFLTLIHFAESFRN